MSKAGHKIIEGLKDAAAGNFARVTIEGQTWVRLDLWDKLVEQVELLARHVDRLQDLFERERRR